MARYTDDHREKTHEAILDAASKLLRDHGFTDTSVGGVMKAVGLTHGGFYAHFPDKTALLVAAVERAFVQSPKNFAALAKYAEAKNDAGFVAEKYLSRERVDDVAGGCPAAALVSELHRQEEPVQKAFHAGAHATATELAKAPGLTRASGEPAWAELALLMGALSMMRAMPDQKLRATIRDQAVAALRQLSIATPAPVTGNENQAQTAVPKAPRKKSSPPKD
jgi:TetR/AcrR family transcriptional regulator, transcriptional repressor for nem operon